MTVERSEEAIHGVFVLHLCPFPTSVSIPFSSRFKLNVVILELPAYAVPAGPAAGI